MHLSHNVPAMKLNGVLGDPQFKCHCLFNRPLTNSGSSSRSLDVKDSYLATNLAYSRSRRSLSPKLVPRNCRRGPEKIRELARRGEAWGILDAKQALEHAIEMGRGGLP